jgi:hypothetical protein
VRTVQVTVRGGPVPDNEPSPEVEKENSFNRVTIIFFVCDDEPSCGPGRP